MGEIERHRARQRQTVKGALWWSLMGLLFVMVLWGIVLTVR